MSERIAQADVVHVARLANLALSDVQVTTMTEQLAAILDHAADVEALDLEGVVPTTHPIALSNVWRDDTLGETIDRDEVLASAPAVDESRFEVPSILGVEP